jgi:hypothetical protein
MHPALEGLIVGFALATVLVGAEYLLLRRESVERAERYKKKMELDDTQRRRLRSLVRFCIFIPVGFAAAFWLMFR